MTDTQNLLPSINQQQRRQHWSRQTLLRSSYQDLGTPETVGKRFQHYLLTNPSTLSSILTVLTSHSTTDDGKTRIKDYSLPIDVHELLSHDPVLGHMLLRHPTTLLPLLEDAVVEAQREVARSAMTIGTKKDYWSSVKGDGDGDDDTRIHARLIHLPPHSSSCRPLLSSLTSLDVGKILQLSGTVVRASKVQMYESQRAFRCCSGSSAGGSRWKKKKEEGCGASFVVKADLLQWNNALCAPSRYVRM